MVKIKVAINGFCRVGRSVFKIAQSRSDIEIAAIRTHLSAEQCAYLLKHDSIYGHYAKAIGTGDASLYSYHKRQADNQIAVGRPRY